MIIEKFKRINFIIFILVFLGQSLSFGETKDIDYSLKVNKYLEMPDALSLLIEFKSGKKESLESVYLCKKEDTILFLSSTDKQDYSFKVAEIFRIINANTGEEISDKEMMILSHWVYGNNYFHYNELVKAKDEFRALISIAPQIWQAYHNLGLCLEAHGNYSEANKMYQKELELSDNHKSFNAKRIIFFGIKGYGNPEEINKFVLNYMSGEKDFTLRTPPLYEFLAGFGPTVYDCQFELTGKLKKVDKDILHLELTLGSLKTNRIAIREISGKDKRIADMIHACLNSLLLNSRQLTQPEADSLVGKKGFEVCVGYKLKSIEGESIDIEMVYVADERGKKSELLDAHIFPPGKLISGEKTCILKSEQGQDVFIRGIFENGEITKVHISADKPAEINEKVEQVLTVKSEGGYRINFIFKWKNGELEEARIRPVVDPLKSFVEVLSLSND